MVPIRWRNSATKCSQMSFGPKISPLPTTGKPGNRSARFRGSARSPTRSKPTRRNNLLVIRYRAGVGSSDVERCAVEVSKALTGLTPGFRLLADFTDLESMDVACAPHLRHIMQLCNEKEVSAVVRVIPNPQRDIGLRIMSFFHYGPDVHIATCATLDEAREILERRQSQLPGATMASISEPEE